MHMILEIQVDILINNEIIEYTGLNKSTNKFTTTLQKRGDNFTTVGTHSFTNIIKSHMLKISN